MVVRCLVVRLEEKQSLDGKASIQHRDKPEGRPYSVESVTTSVGWSVGGFERIR